MTFRKNQTVEYIGNIVPLLHGKRGKVDSVVRRGGWIDVDFGDGHGIVRCGTISLRAVGKSAVEPDHRDDTVDALVQAESFISGFEDDAEQEGVADTLAGLRAAIHQRAQARGEAIAKLQEAVDAWPQFDVATVPLSPGCIPEEQEAQHVDGGDMVEWFAIWRAAVKEMLSQIEGRAERKTTAEPGQAAQPDLIGALTDAETCLANTLTARGYKPGSNTDGWSPEVRLEVRTLAALRATIAQMEGR